MTPEREKYLKKLSDEKEGDYRWLINHFHSIAAFHNDGGNATEAKNAKRMMNSVKRQFRQYVRTKRLEEELLRSEKQ